MNSILIVNTAKELTLQKDLRRIRFCGVSN